MGTAQETFRRMLKEEVAPGLRALGFRGSGQNYQLPSETYWALLGFQRAFSDAKALHFTLNLHVVLRSAWEVEGSEHPWMSVRPTATTGGWKFTWWKRIGELTPTGQDLWWELRACTDSTMLAAAVLWAVEDFSLPAMREQLRT